MTVPEPGAPELGCADVVNVDVRASNGRFDFEVSVRSADTGWDKYADAWEVRGADGVILATRELVHPHETEQPFTRSLNGVDIPDSLSNITVIARDSVLGFCGESITVSLPGRS